MTNGGTCAIINSQKVKDRPKNQKGFEIMSENKTVKITKAMRFSDIRAMLAGDEIPMVNGAPRTSTDDALTFIDHEIELVTRKNSSGKNGKQTDAQKKNAEYKAMIVEFMRNQPDGYAATCTAIGNSIPELVEALGAQATTSKFASLCNSLVAELVLVKKSVKNQSLFSLA